MAHRVAPDHPTLTAAIEELKARGIPVFSLLSDFAAGVRDGYVGLDNRKVGRTAAWMIAKAAKQPGKVAMFVGSHRFHGHELREIGFRSYFRENAPEFTVLETHGQPRGSGRSPMRRRIDLLAAPSRTWSASMSPAAAWRARSRRCAKRGRPAAGSSIVQRDSRRNRARRWPTGRHDGDRDAAGQACRELVELMVDAIEAEPPAAPGQTFLPFDIFLAGEYLTAFWKDGRSCVPRPPTRAIAPHAPSGASSSSPCPMMVACGGNEGQARMSGDAIQHRRSAQRLRRYS